MKSARGTGLYWRISIGPRAVAASSRAALSDAGSRTSAAKPRAVMLARSSAAVSSSSRRRLRATSATE